MLISRSLVDRLDFQIVLKVPPIKLDRLLAVDMREIAKRAGVSIATVSRVVNRVPNVDPLLAKQVWKVVTELGYYPNTLARSLAQGKSRVFGLIVSEITNPFFPEVVQSFEDIAVRHNYEILLMSTVHDPKRMALAVRRMIERRVDAVAVLTFGMEESLIQDLRHRKLPLVFVDVEADVPGVSNIRINYQHGIRQAVQHLAALGHLRIAFIGGPMHLKTARARRIAFENAMHEIGRAVPADLILTGDHTPEGGMRAFAELIGLPATPTAVICSNDMTAIGVMREAHEYGLRIPHDLSLVGFDDIRLSSFMTPPLTTVRLSQTLLGEYAFKTLIDNVEGHDTPPQDRGCELVTNLILRGSTALAPRESQCERVTRCKNR
jgi:DNA-binding LacI/PurR family transcriptional regulator